MAINYLSAIDLNQNELKKARIENVSGTSGVPGAEGQLIYDSVADDLKVYADGAWTTLITSGSGGVVESITAGNGIFKTGTASAPIISVAYTESSAGSLDNIIQKAPTGGTLSGTAEILVNTSLTGTSNAAKVALNTIPISHFGTATGSINMGGTNRIQNLAEPLSNTDAATKQYVDNSDTGVASITEGDGIEVTNPTGSSPEIAIRYTDSGTGADDNIINIAPTGGSSTLSSSSKILVTKALTGSEEAAQQQLNGIPFSFFADATGNISMGSNKIEDLAPPVASTDAASKLYVDQAIVGSLQFQGGYDATQSPPSGSSVGKGYTYAVTAAGDGSGFFSKVLRVGDMIISNQLSPLDEDDWTEVQSNLDFATAGTTASAERGIAGFDSTNFNVSSNGFVEAIVATTGNPGIAAVSAGTGLTLQTVNSGIFVVGIDTTADANPTSFHSDLTSQNSSIIRLESGGITKYSIALGTAKSWSAARGDSAIIQLLDASSGAVVYTDTAVSSTNHINGGSAGGPWVNFTFNQSVANNDYKVSIITTL
jgi:hypothetical protein